MTGEPLPDADRAALLAELAAFPAALGDAVAGLTPRQLTERPVAGEWSVAQNIHHCVDSHLNAYLRCKLIATEVGPVLRPYDEAAWGELPDASAAEVAGSLGMLDLLHQRWVAFLGALDGDARRRTGYHPGDARLVSQDDQLRLYVEHGRAHLLQIAGVRAAL